jgi:hypothetical protein
MPETRLLSRGRSQRSHRYPSVVTPAPPDRQFPFAAIGVALPPFGLAAILGMPQSQVGIRPQRNVALGSAMGTMSDHRRCAEECVAMARLSEDTKDKALWLTLAQSWVRLADHVARGETALEPDPEYGDGPDRAA